MSYVFYAGWFAIVALALYSWLPMVRCYGWRCIPMVPVMWRLHSRSRRAAAPKRKRTPFAREIIQYLIASAVCFYFGGFWSMIGGTLVVLAIARMLFAGRVPIILLLGTSSDPALRLQRGLISLLHGGMVASLLDVNATHDPVRYAGYVFRTFDDDDWKDSIRKLADNVALIVVDARTATSIVEFEARWMLEEYRDKTLFVMTEDGQTPALADVTTSLPWVVHVPALTVAALASEIRTVGVSGIRNLRESICQRLALG